MTTESGLLRVYVYGASEGESIALHLPNGAWGVVDSFASSPRDPATNPIHRLLRDKNVTEIEFLCITHPHADHFMGMSQLFRDFEVKHFWTFIGLEPTDFKLLQTYFLTEAAQANRATLREAAQELSSIFDAAKSSGIEPRLVMSGRRFIRFLVMMHHASKSGESRQPIEACVGIRTAWSTASQGTR